MISNVGVHRSGEFIYQDYVYDDHGPNTTGVNRVDLIFGAWPSPSEADPRLSPTGGTIRYSGDYLYGAEDDHMDNVADLVEMRLTREGTDLYYRFVLGALVEPDDTVIGVCVDEDQDRDTGLADWPFGVGLDDRLGCEHHLTVVGTDTFVTDAEGTSRSLTDLGGATRADTQHNVIEVRVPSEVADPEAATWRYTVGSGLWDADEQAWDAPLPGPQVVGHSEPTGGGDGSAPLIWDLLSNNDESNSYWREERQADDLADHDLANHFLDVDFDRMADGRDDPDPQLTGVINRLYYSQFPMEPDQGLTIRRNIASANYVYHGRYQPYAAAIPSDYYETLEDDPDAEYPLDMCLHPLNGNHMVEVYYGQAFADRTYNPLVTGTVSETGYLGFDAFEEHIDDVGAVYACVLGRGEGYGYDANEGMLDVLEVQADMERRYDIDADRRTMHGISMGAGGTWQISSLYPDRYSAIMTYTAQASDSEHLDNLHNVPALFADGTLDQFGQGVTGELLADDLEERGNEFAFVHYLGRQHEGRIANDVLPFAKAIGYDAVRDGDPAELKYLYDPERFNERLSWDGSVYWASGMEPRDDGTARIDATSWARADELPTDQVVFDGLYLLPEHNYHARMRGLLRMDEEEFAEFWDPAAWEDGWQELSLSVEHATLDVPDVSNGFELTLDNLASVALDAERMGLDLSQGVHSLVRGDGVVRLTLLGRLTQAPEATLDGEPVEVRRTRDGITLELPLEEGQDHELRVGRER